MHTPTSLLHFIFNDQKDQGQFHTDFKDLGFVKESRQAIC